MTEKIKFKLNLVPPGNRIWANDNFYKKRDELCNDVLAGTITKDEFETEIKKLGFFEVEWMDTNE